jgi:UDPglucose--hexose-1-phosphate uridylyltransferase
VIIAAKRAGRPNEFQGPETRRADQSCPFCAGQEHRTPPPTAVYHSGMAGGSSGLWQVRVVPNLFPALQEPGPFAPQHHGPYQWSRGVGVHEVLIESPRHVAHMSQQSDEEIDLTFRAYRDRIQAAGQVAGVAHALVFKNAGPAAGASLEHAHSHLTATPMVPALVREEMDGVRRHDRQYGRCVFCDMIQQEQRDLIRVLERTAHFIAFCPFASRFAGETWILPLQHACHFQQTSDECLPELGRLVRRSVQRLENALGRPAYNYVIHTAPFDIECKDHYHWHIEILPRIAKAGGFEWGTGYFINSVPPEEAALALRTVTPS